MRYDAGTINARDLPPPSGQASVPRGDDAPRSRVSPLGAVNRFYYAAFYAAKAVLATKGLDSSKHSGVIALFQQHFVKTGVIDQAIAKALPRAFEWRLDTDYEDFASIEDATVNDIADQVRTFVDTCEAWLRKQAKTSRARRS